MRGMKWCLKYQAPKKQESRARSIRFRGLSCGHVSLPLLSIFNTTSSALSCHDSLHSDFFWQSLSDATRNLSLLVGCLVGQTPPGRWCMMSSLSFSLPSFSPPGLITYINPLPYRTFPLSLPMSPIFQHSRIYLESTG